MSTLEIKQELHKIIDNSDDVFVKKIYQLSLQHQHQLEMDKMILEGEEDIKNGDVLTTKELKQSLKNWREKLKL